MSETSNWLVHDHQKYDEALEACEMAAEVGEWKNATRLFKEFVKDLKLHMRLEDEVLYPFFLKELGDPEGEISDLSEEHDDLVRLLRDLAYIIKTNDFDHFLDSIEPLHKAMIEHSMHEENVFRCMDNDSLLTHRDEILARLKSLQHNEGRRTWDF